MKSALLMIFIAATSVAAQKTFDLKNASKYFDIRVKVAACDELFCRGKAVFSFYKKGASMPYQVIDFSKTLIQLGSSGSPLVNVNLLYDAQSVVNVGDFNFDGMDDIALCDGEDGSYGGPSYRVYLSSRAAGKFVFNKPLTDLGRHLAMFTVDRRNKTLETFDKSGCCWHITERYKVVRDRPVKVFEEVEDATADPNGRRVRVTTKTLVSGKWKTSVRYEKIQR
jgi:hypothetical protein